jgi:hypothetical protein
MWIVEERPHDDLANSGVGHRIRIHKEVGVIDEET